MGPGNFTGTIITSHCQFTQLNKKNNLKKKKSQHWMYSSHIPGLQPTTASTVPAKTDVTGLTLPSHKPNEPMGVALFNSS